MNKPRSRFARVFRGFGWGVMALVALGGLATLVGYVRSGNDCPSPEGAVPADPIRTWIHCEYGGPEVLRLAPLPRPVLRDSQVLVRVHAASINAGDWRIMRGEPVIARYAMGLRKPSDIRLGSDFAGVVEAVGRAVTRFRPGDSVWGARTGAFAEHVIAREALVMPKPAGLTFEQAAAVPVAAITALQGLREQGAVRAGQHVLVNGASGGVGTFTVQMAKALGAEVTGVCSTRNVDLVRSLGADHVIDYTKEDFAAGSVRYDLVIDNVGNRSLGEFRRVLKPGGMLVLIGGGSGRWFSSIPRILVVALREKLGDQHTRFFIAQFTAPDLTLINDWLATGRIVPAVDTVFAFHDLPDAVRYVERGARAKVVVRVP